MPTYQYACTACGHQLDAVQSFSDAPLTECPECHGNLRKVFSSVGIVFKGSGFYRTDSRAGSAASDSPKSDSSSTPTPSATPAAPAAPSTPSPSSDAKPAAPKSSTPVAS